MEARETIQRIVDILYVACARHGGWVDEEEDGKEYPEYDKNT